jgi:hypothetical protein
MNGCKGRREIKGVYARIVSAKTHTVNALRPKKNVILNCVVVWGAKIDWRVMMSSVMPRCRTKKRNRLE